MLYWAAVIFCLVLSLILFTAAIHMAWELYTEISQEKSDKYRATRRAERKARQAFDDMVASHRDALWRAITK